MPIFAIMMATSRMTAQVNLCSGSHLTDEEKENEEITASYDILVGKGMFFVALQYCVISGLIYLALLIGGILYIVKGKEWVLAKMSKKKDTYVDNSSLV